MQIPAWRQLAVAAIPTLMVLAGIRAASEAGREGLAIGRKTMEPVYEFVRQPRDTPGVPRQKQ